MSLPGNPDLTTAIPFSGGLIWRPFGGGAYLAQPRSCVVLAGPDGDLLWQLDLARAFTGRDSRATFSCTVGAQYALDEGLDVLRELDGSASLSPAVLTDWVFRLAPTPALAAASDLSGPVPMVSAGLGTGRLYAQLSLDSGLLLEQLLRDGGALWGTAEATLSGVSARLPAAVSFDPAVLVPELLKQADGFGALPYDLLLAAFSGDVVDLPLVVSGTLADAGSATFAQAMTDRVVGRFGTWVPAQDPADAPVVRLVAGDPGRLTWSLAEPTLVQRRVLLPVDLLGAARERAAERGADSLVTRRDLVPLPSLGQTRLTVLSTLPAAHAGIDVLGVEVEFPPYPPARPQPRWATAELVNDEPVELDVHLSPDEPLRYRATPFAVVADETGTRRLDGAELVTGGPVLRLGPDQFPVELVSCAVSPELARLAVVTGVCSYEQAGQVHERQLALDSGRFVTAVAVPRDRSWLRIDLMAVAREGSGSRPLGPYESGPVRLDLASFPTYGPQRLDLRCVFDDGATSQAVDLLPAGLADLPENVTTVMVTPEQPTRTHRWFATSPFDDGIRYRPYGSSGGWRTHRETDRELVLFSSVLTPVEAGREVVVRSARQPAPGRRETFRVTEAVLAGREAAAADPGLESAVVPVATSPSPSPTDEMVYVRTDDPTRTGYVPRYAVDLTSSGQPRYRIAMRSTAEASTLTVNLRASAADAVLAQAPEATELPHALGVGLEFLLAAGGGATKTVEFSDVTRSGSVVTAVLTFASLMERDDVYGALTDPARQARLVTHRAVDLLIPTSQTAPITSLPVSVMVLPDRPVFTKWVPLPFPTIRRPVPGPPVLVPLPSGTEALADQPASPVLVAGTGGSAALRPLLRQARPGALSSELVGPRLITGIPVSRASEHARVLELRRRDDDGGGFPDPPDPPEPKPRPRPVTPPPPPTPPAPVLPVPQLSLVGRNVEPGLTRFMLQVDNWGAFSDDFFAASPDLPPCGLNTSSSRTWVDILDAGSGSRIYGFCALGTASNLNQLWFAVMNGTPAPASVQIQLNDRRTGVLQRSNAVSTADVQPPPPPPPPAFVPVRQDLRQVVAPDPFAFSPALHGYIFDGVDPSGDANRLIRYRLPRDGRSHVYLQDPSRPWVVYVFPDEFKIARRPSAPFTPFATVRVTTSTDGRVTTVVFDYVVAPHVEQARLREAETALLADPSFGPDRVEFQPFATRDVSFTTSRPTESGSSTEQRPDVAIVLQSALRDTLSMPLGDFRLLYDAMQGQTALFSGHVDIGIGDDGLESIPFTAQLGDLEGELFSYEATLAADGQLDVRLTNRIESPLDLHALDVTLVQPDLVTRGAVRSGLPKDALQPDETLDLRIEPATPLTSGPAPELVFDLGGVTVHPDPAAIWASILDTTTVAYFRVITVKVQKSRFDVVAGSDAPAVVAIVVDFEGSGSVQLDATTPTDASTVFAQTSVQVNYSIDAVILHQPVSRAYRYTVKVFRAGVDLPQGSPEPTTATSDVLFV